MSDHLGKRLSALIDGELGDADRERVLSHLARCEPCRAEARALRVIKQRMRALGDATAGDALTRRLIAMAAFDGQPAARGPAWPLRGRRRRGRVLIVAGVALIGLFGVPAAAFVAGGAPRHPQGPRVTPSVDVFMVQHAITIGEVPARALPSAVPSFPDVATQAP